MQVRSATGAQDPEEGACSQSRVRAEWRSPVKTLWAGLRGRNTGMKQGPGEERGVRRVEALLSPPLLQAQGREATTVLLIRLHTSPRHKLPGTRGTGEEGPACLAKTESHRKPVWHGLRSAERPSSAVCGRGRLTAPTASGHVTDGHCARLPPWWGSQKSPANTRPRTAHAPTAFVAKPSARCPQPPEKGWKSSSSRSDLVYTIYGIYKTIKKAPPS